MNEKNKRALNATVEEGAVAYSNKAIDMALNSKRKDLARKTFDPVTGESIDWDALTPAEERELYSFVAHYAYIQDIIAGVITYDPAHIDDSDDDFYSITLNREGVEFYGTDTVKAMNADLWHSIIYLAKHPSGLKSIPVKLANNTSGRIILQPYVIKVLYEEMEENNLNIALRVKEVRIMFAKYLYKDLYEQGENFTKLGKCLFAKIKWIIDIYDKPNKPDGTPYEKDDLSRFMPLLTDEEVRLFKQWGENPLQPIQIYKAVLYFARHDNGKSKEGTLDAVDFCNSVEPSVLRLGYRPVYEIDEHGKRYIAGEERGYVFKEAYYKEKLKVDIYARVFDILYMIKQISGMKFTTCKAYLDKDKMKIRINYTRDSKKNGRKNRF